MNATEINQMIYYHAGKPGSRMITDSFLALAQTEAINQMALALYAACPEYWEICKSLSGTANVFTLPSDLIKLKSVWDLGTTAGDVSGAADNGSGAVRITQTAHGYSDGATVTIHDIVGTTEANGTWPITYVSANTYDLDGSTFASAYTSGGKTYEEKASAYADPIDRAPSENQSAADGTQYFLRGGTIIVDQPDFANDILVLYRYLPDELTDIPTRMHDGVWAYGVLKLLRIPPKKADDYADAMRTYDMASQVWQNALSQAQAFAPVVETRKTSRRVAGWL